MKKFGWMVLTVLGFAGMVALMARGGWKGAGEGMCAEEGARALPEVAKTGWGDLGEALWARASDRSMAAGAALGEEELGRVLWAACGVNRKDGKWTIATARNRRDLRVYVCEAGGAWRYESEGHRLVKVSGADLRGATGRQAFAGAAAAELVYAADLAAGGGKGGEEAGVRERLAMFHAGEAAQSVALACAAGGLKCVVHALHGAEEEGALRAGLGLGEDEVLLIAQAVGR